MTTVERAAHRAHRIAIAAAIVRRALEDRDCQEGVGLSPDELACMLGLIESGAVELRDMLDGSENAQ